MLVVTETAGARLNHLLSTLAEDSVARIVRGKSRLRLRRDHVRPNDKTFAHNGRIVLALDKKMSASLSSRELELRETDDGPRLGLKKR